MTTTEYITKDSFSFVKDVEKFDPNLVIARFNVKSIFTIIALRSSHPEVFLRKVVLKRIYRRAPMPNMISVKLLCNFIEIVLQHRCTPVNLLHIFRTLFFKNISGRLLLFLWYKLLPFVCRIFIETKSIFVVNQKVIFTGY